MSLSLAVPVPRVPAAVAGRASTASSLLGWGFAFGFHTSGDNPLSWKIHSGLEKGCVCVHCESSFPKPGAVRTNGAGVTDRGGEWQNRVEPFGFFPHSSRRHKILLIKSVQLWLPSAGPGFARLGRVGSTCTSLERPALGSTPGRGRCCCVLQKS